MAASKLVKTVEWISGKVTDTYWKIEDIMVKGYTSVEDFFVNRYLTHDEETVEEAKKRLKEK